MTTSAPIARTKRRPVRGAIFGLLLGLGGAILLVLYSVIALGTLPVYFVVGGGLVLGVVWGLFGPTKRTRELPPSRVRSMPEATTPPGGTEKAGGGDDAAEGGEG